VELVNPELVLATLDSPEAYLEMELTVERGRGYASSDARDGLPIGTIPVDAIFSPIPKVNYLIEGAHPDLLSAAAEDEEAPEVDAESLRGMEQLIIEIWTDGTIDPGEALSLAGQYLAQHSSLISNFNRQVAPQPGRDLAGVAAIPAHLFEMPIDELNLSMRTYNCLKRSGITKVGQVLTKDRKELLGLRNFGQKSLVELYQALSTRDLIPPGTPLDVTPDQIYGTEGEGDTENADGDVDVDYTEVDDNPSEAEGFLAEPGTDESEVSTAVVDSLGVSEGSAAMSAGIYVDDEYTGTPVDDKSGPARRSAKNSQIENGAEQEV
jgi:hypothetical protein